MVTRVGILHLKEARYSTDWMDADSPAETGALRTLGRALGFAGGNFLAPLIRPGDRVVVKPNWVEHRHLRGGEIIGIVTHSSVLRAVVDLVFEALRGEGSIVLADAPVFGCDFGELMRITQAERICDYYRQRHGFEIAIRDLRTVAAREQGEAHHSAANRLELPGDPEGYVAVDLGRDSAFAGMPHAERLFGDDYDRSETVLHHNPQRHEYLVSRTVLNADVVISVPKLKVHCKVGTTLNAKGMVGINGNKNWVAHYRLGPPSDGGDEFPDSEPAAARTKTSVMHSMREHLLTRKSPGRELLYHAAVKTFRTLRPVLGELGRARHQHGSGNWYGNDTAWRMTADLARIVLFADSEGRLCETPQRRFASVVDGIVGGEREGPLAADPKPAGVLVAGDSLLGVDLAASRLMGFDWRKIRYLSWLVDHAAGRMNISDPAEEIEIVSNVEEWRDLLRDRSCPDLAFEPAAGWKGQVELTD
jgi:uncharacterized protein (DUF362 family)